MPLCAAVVEKEAELVAFKQANGDVLDEYSSMFCAEQEEVEAFIRNHFAVFVAYNDLRLELSKLYENRS